MRRLQIRQKASVFAQSSFCSGVFPFCSLLFISGRFFPKFAVRSLQGKRRAMKHAQLEVICMRAVQETQKNVFLINKAKLAVQQADKASKIRYKQLFNKERMWCSYFRSRLRDRIGTGCLFFIALLGTASFLSACSATPSSACRNSFLHLGLCNRVDRRKTRDTCSVCFCAFSWLR